tara:strand:+ start:2965 stop:3117 length:153 start_codon:yes stop_codon:yes gene_type:complete
MRATNFISFINEENIPYQLDRKHYYTHIEITEKIVNIRKKYRRNLKKNAK